MDTERKRTRLAVVTGASTGIGYELAKICAEEGFDLVIGADEPAIVEAAESLAPTGAAVEAVEADLGTLEGMDELCEATDGRPVEVLIANAGRGLGGPFLDQDFREVCRVLDTNVLGTTYLLHRIGRDMRGRGRGHILITGSIAGFMPGTYQTAYNATKAYLDSFAFALREELDGSDVSVTCLIPGPTETAFFERAGMQDTKLGQSDKDDAATVARRGYDAMMRGEDGVVTGWRNKLQSALASIAPSKTVARIHVRSAAPGSGRG